MSELERLTSLGWYVPEPSDDGVRYTQDLAKDISYPTGVFETHISEGGGGFWLDARALEVSRALRNRSITALWDVGAGSGAMARRLPERGVEVISVEPLQGGARECAAVGGPAFCGTLKSLHLPDASIHAIGLFDVLEHLADPLSLLREIDRVLTPRGALIATVPAFPWLWSADDEILGHFRRYTRGSLTTALTQAGFRVTEMRYLFASLVVPAWLLRSLPHRLSRRRKSPEETIAKIAQRIDPSPTLNAIALGVLKAEHGLASKIRLPAGTSLLVVAQKQSHRN